MPWMIPPSTWLDAPSGLITRPTSWIAATRSTRDLARLDVDGDLRDLDAERQHLHPGRVRAARALAEDLRVLEQADDLLERPRAAVRPRRRCRPSARARALPGRSAARRSRASAAPRPRAAARTAGPIDGVVDEPAEIDAYGPRAESPSARSDAGRAAARAPRPRSALIAVARAGADVLHRRDDRRAPVGAEPHPRVRGRPAAAVPDLATRGRRRASTVARSRARTSSRRCPVRLGAPVALHQVLRRVRPRRRSSRA